jgi:hypothetical protein
MPELLRGHQVVVVEAAYLGDEALGRELLRPLLALGPEADTFATVPARSLIELHRDPPGPVPGRGDGWLLDAFDPAAAAAIVEAAAMDGTAPLISVEVKHLEGALGRPDRGGGVLSHVEAAYAMYSVGTQTSPEAGVAIDERLTELRGAAAPWLSHSTFFNFAEREVDADTLFPDGAYERLTKIRSAVDPDGLFSAKHTIA